MKELLSGVVSALQDAVARRAGLTHDSAAVQRMAELLEIIRADDATDGADGNSVTRSTPELPAQRWASLLTVCALNETQRRLLLVAVAAEIDPRLAAVIALLQGGAAGPTTATVLELAGVGLLTPERGELSASGVLCRSRLVTLVGDGPFLDRTVRVPDRLIGHLVGGDRPDPRTAAMAVTLVPLATAEALTTARYLEHGRRFCYLREGPQSAALAAAAGAFAQAGIRWTAVDLRCADPAGPLEDAVAAALLDATLLGLGLVLGGFDLLAAPPAQVTAIRMLLDAPVPVVACGSLPWSPWWADALPAVVPARRLDAELTATLWTYALGDAGRLLTEAGWVPPALRPEEILRAARHALDAAATAGTALTAGHLVDASQLATAANDTPGLARHLPRARRADLVLPPTTAGAVDELLGWMAHRHQVLGSGRLSGRARQGEGITALFTGGPGTGKTLAAEAIAGELGLELMTVDLPTIIDKYIGETEKNLERVFAAAEESQALLFFDEADALFGSRSSVSDARDRYANQEVAYLLQRMEAFAGTAILATNLRGNLDPAFTRRLHFVIPFLDPDPLVRRQLWLGHLAELPEVDPGDPFDVDVLATQAELSGGGIRNVVMAAAFAGAVAGVPVGMRHVRAAAAREFDKTGRRAPAALLGR